MNCKDHWNQVYETKAPDELSWFQPSPATSLKLIEAAGGAGRAGGIIDVGGGASLLVDRLLEAGAHPLAVLDISAAALAQAGRRLGARAREIAWIEADLTDVTEFNPPSRFGVWHDRAVFHFLTSEADRAHYVQNLRRTLTPGGAVIIATFALDGPLKCSGLEVARYDAATISAQLGSAFQLMEQVDETHVTPWNTPQKFSYFRFALRALA